MNEKSVAVQDRDRIALESKETTEAASPSHSEEERLVREYYEAESWQFSGCGD